MTLVVLLSTAQPALGQGQDVDAAAIAAETAQAIEDAVPAQSVPPAVGGAYACDSSGAAGQLKGGGVSISIPTYPCEVARTFQTLDELDERGGWLAGTAGVFLRIRLVTRGIFSAVFGLFGLG